MTTHKENSSLGFLSVPAFINIFGRLILITFALEFSDPQPCLYILNFPRMQSYQVNFFNYNTHNNNKTAVLDMKSKFLSLHCCRFPGIMGPSIWKFWIQIDKQGWVQICDKVIQSWETEPCSHVNSLYSHSGFYCVGLLSFCPQSLGSWKNGCSS